MSSTTGSISGSIKWTGLASGTDFASVVDKLVAIERRTITRQETWKAEWQEKITAISGLNTRLVSLKLDAQSKDIRSELLTRKATVTNESVMSVVNTSTASLGSYDITVGTNIKEKWASRSYNEPDPVGGTDGQTIVIQVGSDPARKITLIADDTNPSPPVGYFYTGGNIEDLAAAIEAALQDPGAPPDMNLKVSVINDKMIGSVQTKRLVLTSTDGGSQNHITVTDGDPDDDTTQTDLHLGSTYIDQPVYNAFLGSDLVASIDPTSEYTGAVNKSFTFMALNTGVLGTDDLQFQWADTEGHTGKFTVVASEWAATPSKKYEIFQGLSINFDTGTYGRLVANEAFSIDCQAPVLQKGQDSGMAQSDKMVHDGFADQISPIISGTSAVFTYIYQGQEHTITVPDRTSLGNLANLINSSEDNPGVTATVVNDGQGTSTSYHLVLTGNHTGAESTLEISDKTTLAGFEAANFTKAREAGNAMVKVDGFPAGDDSWLQRASNQVSDVVDGCVITLNGVGDSTLTVNNDAAGMRDKIVQIVESINFCKTYILDNTKWGGSNLVTGMDESTGEITTSRENPNGLMIGNYGFQIAQSNLDRIMNTSIIPFSEDPSLDIKARLEKRQKYCEDNGLVYTSFSDIGITSDPDNKGLYKVEQAKLLECINQNPEAVIKLFTFTDEYADVGADGKTKMVEIRGVNQELNYILTKMTSDTDVYDDAGNMIQKGKGTMVLLQENYQGIIENINAKIAREERRIEAVRARYTDRFNRLEAALQQLQDKQSQLESSISSLSSNSSS
ncbi:MAG: flagellar filament capping protein FliD [Deltaproteobacteria bacterium]|jgi:flagellar hook-associated protein 2|nr:flagellar filament capping protein FliD [Deltaproteobacteria bacterium]